MICTTNHRSLESYITVKWWLSCVEYSNIIPVTYLTTWKLIVDPHVHSEVKTSRHILLDINYPIIRCSQIISKGVVNNCSTVSDLSNVDFDHNFWCSKRDTLFDVQRVRVWHAICALEILQHIQSFSSFVISYDNPCLVLFYYTSAMNMWMSQCVSQMLWRYQTRYVWRNLIISIHSYPIATYLIWWMIYTSISSEDHYQFCWLLHVLEQLIHWLIWSAHWFCLSCIHQLYHL